MSYHILIIDDEIEVASMLQSFLQRKSYQADYCLDGAEAIGRIRDRAGSRPDNSLPGRIFFAGNFGALQQLLSHHR